MSARRQARARDVAGLVATSGGVPPALLIGRCIEVWSDPTSEVRHLSAFRRFGAARSWWLDRAGITSGERFQLIPTGAPWSVEFLLCERPEVVAERLARAGCTVADLPDLTNEATDLYGRAARETAYSRSRSE